jgi:hypothetical protein
MHHNLNTSLQAAFSVNKEGMGPDQLFPLIHLHQQCDIATGQDTSYYGPFYGHR